MSTYHIQSVTEKILAAIPAKFYVRTVEKTPTDGVVVFRVKKRKNGGEVASFSTRSLPGCCGVLLVYGFSAADHVAMVDIMLGVLKGAKAGGYGAVMCTLTGGSLLTALAGHTDVKAVVFRNAKTDRVVTQLTFDLKQPERPKPKDAVVEDDDEYAGGG